MRYIGPCAKTIEINDISCNYWTHTHRNVMTQCSPQEPNNTMHTSGPGCSKLTISLVNVSLKFQMLISEICQYFLLKKMEKLLQCKSFSHFFNKNISVFGYKVVKHLTS